ncbi:MAG: hypothetical protein ACU85E_14005 [Gammaproteobacteria bacterium]
MNYLSCSKTHTYLYLSIALLGSGCTALFEKQDTPFDPASIGTMQLRFEQSPSLATAFPKQAIAERVAANLAEWSYTVDAETKDYSHILAINIAPVEHGPTPVGFSFSAGNSDPRSLDFQKSDVIPVTCALMPKDRTEQRAEMTMDFIADDYAGFAELNDYAPELIDMLVDDVSTVCFNLLAGLNVKTVPSEHPENTKPGWIPEIRVEIDNATEAAPVTATPAPEQAPRNSDTSRKRIIIHNQGSPVIFKFGHERK